MTGKDLIIYILKNDLENEEFFVNGRIPGLITDYEAALKCGVGIATVHCWLELGYLKGVRLGHQLYIFEPVERPNNPEL